MPDAAQQVEFRVRHRTAYQYDSPVSDAYSVTCLVPRDTPNQRVVRAEITTTPDADEFDDRVDVFGNRIVQLGLHRPHERFEVVCESFTMVARPPLPESSLPWESVAATTHGLRGDEAIAIGAYRATTTLTRPATAYAALTELGDRSFLPGRPIVEAIAAFCSDIFATFVFDATATDLSTPLDDVLGARRGVCQDFAHLAVAVCRARGLAARYVSGYIETDPPPGVTKLIGSDASHAWCSVWVPDHGWLDFDPTNDQTPPERHVTVAWGRDYADVAPVRGVVIGPATTQQMDVAVDVARTAG